MFIYGEELEENSSAHKWEYLKILMDFRVKPKTPRDNIVYIVMKILRKSRFGAVETFPKADKHYFLFIM